MQERILCVVLVIVGVGILLYGSNWGILPLALGLILGGIFYRMENKTGYFIAGEVAGYEIVDAKLTDDRE